MSARKKVMLFGTTIDYQLRYHAGLESLLAKRGWSVHVVSSPGPILSDLSVHDAVTAHAIPMERIPSPLKDLVSLLRWIVLLCQVRPAVVHCGTPKASLLGLSAAWFCRVPVRVYELHGLRLETLRGRRRLVMRAIEQLTCWMATDVIAVGHSLLDRAVEAGVVASNRVQVLGAGSPNGVDLARFRNPDLSDIEREQRRIAIGLRPRLPVISFVGRLSEDKGLGVLSKASRELSGRLPHQVLVVGPVEDHSGQEGLRMLDESSHVVATGFVEDVSEFLSLADVVCLPSRREGLPTVILEAFAACVPVVATAATGTVDLIKDRVTGLLVPIDDSSALATALETMLLDSKLAQSCVNAAFELVSSAYGRNAVQRQWADFLDLLKSGSQS